MSKAPRCDACNRRIRPNQHELVLSDAATGQVLGRYHASLGIEPGLRGHGSIASCQGAVAKYFEPGVVVQLTYYHPDRCGPNQESCDGGESERVA